MPRFDDCLEGFLWLPHWDGQPLHTTPGDPGGATAWGVTLATYADWRRKNGSFSTTVADLGAATKAQLSELIHTEFWLTVRADELGPGPDIMSFDFGYNAGPGSATRALQKAVGATVDGRLGPVTVAAAVASARTDRASLIRRLADEQMAYYRQRSDYAEFGHGWSNRTQARLAFALASGPSASPAKPAPALAPAAPPSAAPAEPGFLSAAWEGLRHAV